MQGTRVKKKMSIGKFDKHNLVNKANLLYNFSWYVYFFSLHVSGDYVPIIRRNNCIFGTLGNCYSVWMTMQEHMLLHTRQSSIQNNKYQVSQKYSCFSWWWTHSRPKHVEKRNKHTKKNCTTSWFYLQDYTRMHGQQNVQFDTYIKPLYEGTQLSNKSSLQLTCSNQFKSVTTHQPYHDDRSARRRQKTSGSLCNGL